MYLPAGPVIQNASGKPRGLIDQYLANPRLGSQFCLPSSSRLRIATSDGHQCQPILLNPRASVCPRTPIGMGGFGGV